MIYPLRMTSMAAALLLALGAATTSGCQTSRYQEFGSIKEGMGKDEVLHAAGSPNTSRRWKGRDRWMYRFPNAGAPPTIREVHFQDGHVVYVGARIEAEVSAEQQDRLNAESNQREYRRLQEEAQTRAAATQRFFETGEFESEVASSQSMPTAAAEATSSPAPSTARTVRSVPERLKVAPTWEKLD